MYVRASIYEYQSYLLVKIESDIDTDIDLFFITESTDFTLCCHINIFGGLHGWLGTAQIVPVNP